MTRTAYAIVYSSNTGNTEQLAEAVHAHLPEVDCRYFGRPCGKAQEASLLYIGFWTDKGIADESTLAFLKTLKNKKIFLFGTAGFCGSEAYYQSVLDAVKKVLDASNEVVGTFMCQGKMPMSVRGRYVALKEAGTMSNADEMIANFDEALAHPNDADVENLLQAVDAVDCH